MLEEELLEMAETATMVYLAGCVLESISDDDDRRKRRPRSVWQKKWLKRREKEGFCAKLLMELREKEPELYRNVMRISSEQFNYLLNLVKPHIAKADTKFRQSISAEARLALTLRYLATTGESFNSLRLLFRIAQPTMSAIIPEVLDAIYKILVGDFLRSLFQKNEVEWEAVAKQFWDKWQFPHCIGAVDGKHVVINAPPNAGSRGRCLRHVTKTYANRGLTMTQRVFNYHLSRARRIIENVFGIMSARFRVLRHPILLDPGKAKQVVLACAVLHKFLMTVNKPTYAPASAFDQYDAEDNLLRPADWRAEAPTASMHALQPSSENAKKIQEELMNYFTGEGELNWQYSRV